MRIVVQALLGQGLDSQQYAMDNQSCMKGGGWKYSGRPPQYSLAIAWLDPDDVVSWSAARLSSIYRLIRIEPPSLPWLVSIRLLLASDQLQHSLVYYPGESNILVIYQYSLISQLKSVKLVSRTIEHFNYLAMSKCINSVYGIVDSQNNGCVAATV